MPHITIKNSQEDHEYRLVDRGGPKRFPATIFDDASYTSSCSPSNVRTFAKLLAETARGLQEASFIRRMPTVGLMMGNHDRVAFGAETALRRYAHSAFTLDSYGFNDNVSTITPQMVSLAINHHLQKALINRGCRLKDPAPLPENSSLVKPDLLKEYHPVIKLTEEIKQAVCRLLGQPESERFQRAVVYLANAASMHMHNFDFHHFMKELRATFEAWPIDTENPNEDFSQLSTLNPTGLTSAVRTGITMR